MEQITSPDQLETTNPTTFESMLDTIQDGFNRFAPEGAEDREAGFIQLLAFKALKRAVWGKGGDQPSFMRKILFGSKTRGAATILSGSLAVTTAAGAFINERSIHGGADLDKATTSSQSKALVFNKKQELKVADFYFEEKFSANDIPYTIDWQPIPYGPDVIPDYKENKELNGVGKCSYTIPFSAVTAAFDKKSHKTDYTVDKKQLILDCTWIKPPFIQDFVTEGGKRKYSADGFKSNMVKNISESFTHFSIDNFKNAVNDIDMLADRAITNKALEVSSDKCSEKLDTHLETATKDALVANVESLGQKAEGVGTVGFTEGQWTLNHEQVPAVVQAAVDKTYKHNRNIVVNENFTVDDIKCDTAGMKVN